MINTRLNDNFPVKQVTIKGNFTIKALVTSVERAKEEIRALLNAWYPAISVDVEFEEVDADA